MAKLRTNWAGVFTAAVTPFGSDGEMDMDAMRRLIDLLISEGVGGILVAGSTGEWYSLSDPEMRRLCEVSVSHAKGRVPIIFGTSAIGTREAVERTRMAKDLGADGCMVLPPPYVLASRREVLAHFEAIAKVRLPIMVYNNPLRTGVSIDAALASQLAEFESIVAFKESARDLYQTTETIYALRDSLAVFMGLEPYGLAAINRGCVGLVGSMGNVCALELVEYHQSAVSGNMQTCKEAQQSIDQLYHLMTSSGTPLIPFVKEAMRVLNRPGGVPRLPHVAPDDTARLKIREGLQRMNFTATRSPVAEVCTG